MANKDFKTLDEQIAILESRGLKIPDKSAAKEFLLRNNYYRVSGYSLGVVFQHHIPPLCGN